MDFKERLDMYLTGGMINQNDVKDIEAVIKLFKDDYGVELCEENAATFIAHLAAAYSRNATKEELDDLSNDMLDEIKALDSYNDSLKILDKILEVTNNPLNDVERNYVLLHLNNLIANLSETGEWHAS